MLKKVALISAQVFDNFIFTHQIAVKIDAQQMLGLQETY